MPPRKKILKYPSGVTESGNFECWELFDGTKAKGEVETKGQTMNKTRKFMFLSNKVMNVILLQRSLQIWKYIYARGNFGTTQGTVCAFLSSFHNTLVILITDQAPNCNHPRHKDSGFS